MYGLYGLKHHTVEMLPCGTDKRRTREDKATQPLDDGRLSWNLGLGLVLINVFWFYTCVYHQPLPKKKLRKEWNEWTRVSIADIAVSLSFRSKLSQGLRRNYISHTKQRWSFSWKKIYCFSQWWYFDINIQLTVWSCLIVGHSNLNCFVWIPSNYCESACLP